MKKAKRFLIALLAVVIGVFAFCFVACDEETPTPPPAPEVNISVSVAGDNLTYSGAAVTPAVTVKDGETALTPDTDYTLSYTDNVNAGTGKVTVTFKGNYEGQTAVEKTFTIGVKDASAAAVAVDDIAYGTVPTATVALDGYTLTANDYDIAYGDYSEVAEGVTATVTFKGNFSGTASTTFDVNQALISEADVAVDGAIEYDGTAKTPALTVTKGETTFVAGTDYEVAYSNNINAGSASVTLTFKGNYTGTVNATFTIAPKEIIGGVEDIDSVVYDGTAKTPALTVKDGSVALVKDVDYVVAYTNNINAGTANAVVEYTGNYTGFASKTFVIEKFDLAAATMTVPSDNKLTGFEVKPTPTVTAHGATLDLAQQGMTLSYANNVFLSDSGTTADTYADDYGVGTVTVTAPAEGNYTGSLNADFRFYNPSKHRRIDSDDSDWADYTGNEAVIYSVKEGDTPQLISVTKMWWGDDGVYFFTDTQHKNSEKGVMNQNNERPDYRYSAIALEIKIVRKDEGMIARKDNTSKPYADMTNLMRTKEGYYASSVMTDICSTYVQTGTTGNLNTKIEGYIPMSQIKKMIGTAKHNPDDFFDADGMLKPEYDLRVGVHWNDDRDMHKTYMDGTALAAQREMRTVLRNSFANDSTVINEFWYLDRPDAEINNGLRSSRFVAQEKKIDGNLSDWASFDQAITDGDITMGKYDEDRYSKVDNAWIKDGRKITTRGYWGSDGMYISIDSYTKTLIFGSVVKNAANPSDNMFPNTSLELTLMRTGVNITVNGKTINAFGSIPQIVVVYGGNRSSCNAEVGGEKGIVESCWKYTIEDGLYHSTVEVFVPNSALDFIKAKYDALCEQYATELAAIGHVKHTDMFIGTMLFGSNPDSDNQTAGTSNTTYGKCREIFYNSAGAGSGFVGANFGGAKNRFFPNWSSLD